MILGDLLMRRLIFRSTLSMMEQSQMIDVSWAAVWITEVSAVVDPGWPGKSLLNTSLSLLPPSTPIYRKNSDRTIQHWELIWYKGQTSEVALYSYVVWENYTCVHAYVLYIDNIMCYIYIYYCSWATSWEIRKTNHVENNSEKCRGDHRSSDPIHLLDLARWPIPFNHSIRKQLCLLVIWHSLGKWSFLIGKEPSY